MANGLLWNTDRVTTSSAVMTIYSIPLNPMQLYFTWQITQCQTTKKTIYPVHLEDNN